MYVLTPYTGSEGTKENN